MSVSVLKRPACSEEPFSPSKRFKADWAAPLVLDPALGGEPGPQSEDHTIALSNDLRVEDEIPAESTPPTTPSYKHKPREKKYLCDFPGCGKAYARPVTLSDHQRSHTNERPFVCGRDGCDKSFLRDTHLKHHIKSHHEDVRDYKCDWPGCGQGFATGQRLRAHLKRHEKRESCKCTGFPPCEQYFRKPETLERHIATVHFQDSPFKCDHVVDELGNTCDRRFKQMQFLEQHKTKHHSGARYFCGVCTKSHVDSAPLGFPTYNDFQAHMREAHPPTCEVCGFVCATNGQLKAHMDVEHQSLEARQTVKCQDPDCDRMFTKKGNMLVHYKSYHAKSQFVCGEHELSGSAIAPDWDGSGACGQGFVSKATLEKHVRTQHLHLPLLSVTGKEKRKQRKARMAEQGSGAAETTMDTGVASLLTGFGYETGRRIACAVPDCARRFKRSYDLELHLVAGHGLDGAEAFDVAEGIREQEALSGGQFWVGGDEDADGAEDLELAARLTEVLGMEQQ